MWDSSDHTCQNRDKRRDVLLQQIAEDLGTHNPLFSYQELKGLKTSSWSGPS